MQRTVLSIIALVSFHVNAVGVSGKVTDEQGKPISGAQVSVEGMRQIVETDSKGFYQFTDIVPANVHLHVSSDKYVHGDRDLGEIAEDKVVNFALSPASIENITVTATAMRSSVLESVTPVSVLGEQTLQKQLAPTLGETLKQTPGVHSSYFGPVSSSPVIRGADGPRVKIVQNGLDVSDASRIGPDHNISTSAANARQVEILRGPATLQYGSGAIGGVVNVVDNRIPFTVPYELEAQAEVSYSTVDKGKYADIAINDGAGRLAWHVSGFTQLRENSEIPGFASLNPDKDEPQGVLENSAMDTDNLVAGMAYIGDSKRIGFAAEKLKNEYGVPGHEAHAEEDLHDDADSAHSEEEGVALRADMERYQFNADWDSVSDFLTHITLSAAYTDYQHAEIEEGETATEFKNKSTDVKLSANHAKTGGWHGIVGLQWHDSDYQAVGEEAFTPPTETLSYALFVIEQKKVADITFEMGARLERTDYDTRAGSLALDDAHDEAGHNEGEQISEMHWALANNTDSFTTPSFSVGANWEYGKGQGMAFTLSRSARAPSHQELYSGGQHLASQSYEIGLAYQPEDDTAWQVPVNEVSRNLDFTLRRFTGDWGYTASLFYNDVSDYIYQQNTGEFFAGGAHEEEMPEAHDEGLPIYVFKQSDAKLYGLEIESHWDLTDQFRLQLFGDAIKAKLSDQYLPRIPPMRLGSELSYQTADWLTEVSINWYAKQTDTAPFETATDSYTQVGLYSEYTLVSQNIEWAFYAKIDNLLDEEARVHTSFLKDRAPLPGRNLKLGVRARF